MAGKDVSLVVDDLIAKLPKVAVPTRSKVCIYKVHEKLHAVSSPSMYVPAVVSIGPIHYGDEKLKGTEEVKLYYMSDVLTQRGKKDINSATASLLKCFESTKKLEKEIRECYAEPILLESKEFIEIMVVDGLFIVGLFQNYRVEPLRDDDPLAHNPWKSHNVIWDLLLIENQIPMFVLESLYKLTASDEEQSLKSIGFLSYGFFKNYIHFPRDKTVLRKMKETDLHEGVHYKHLLDHLAKTLHPLTDNEDSVVCPPLRRLIHALRVTTKFITDLFLPKPNTIHTSRLYMPSATQLNIAGIKIVKGSKEASFLDISFKDGVMTIPPVVISGHTELLLRNLIAPEQFSDRYTIYVTSYALFMDRLIVTAKDVEFLTNRGIITNQYGRLQEIADLFSRLHREVVSGAPFYYLGTFDRVNEYYNDSWNFYKAAIKQKYFIEPWVTKDLSFSEQKSYRYPPRRKIPPTHRETYDHLEELFNNYDHLDELFDDFIS
ncbi:hypothetical protein C5167_008014 [Papaver somniferum]|uniref:Uncharacterized protein n=1 Tax=Papaver somniferum TaxID=3469 RepID=A0A4Y7JUT1_PAPSO|nr:UPF0481 protein At3g47200-like [Papaver somniferum]RZC64326.1 hypothetical protein C5167_008014 [Papaver somniferum]